MRQNGLLLASHNKMPFRSPYEVTNDHDSASSQTAAEPQKLRQTRKPRLQPEYVR